jgi:hypothetical protein
VTPADAIDAAIARLTAWTTERVRAEGDVVDAAIALRRATEVHTADVAMQRLADAVDRLLTLESPAEVGFRLAWNRDVEALADKFQAPTSGAERNQVTP